MEFLDDRQVVFDSALWDNLKSFNDIMKYLELKKTNTEESISFKNQLMECLECLENFTTE